MRATVRRSILAPASPERRSSVQPKAHARPEFSADLIFVCDSLGPGGIQRVVTTLANEWSRRGRKIGVITRFDRSFFVLDPTVSHVVVHGERLSRLSKLVERLALAVQRLRKTLTSYSALNSPLMHVLGNAVRRVFFRAPYRVYASVMFFYDVRALRRVLMETQSPVIVAMGTPINLTTVRAAKGLGRRVVVSERSDAGAMRSAWIWGRLSRRLYDGADVVTANTRALVNEMREFVPAHKLAFVPNPIGLWMASASHDAHPHTDIAPGSAPYILSVGRLVPEKAPELLLDAFALQSHDGCRLAFVGTGPLESHLKRHAQRLGISDRVDWLRTVRDPRALYLNARALVHTSRSEGMPNAVLEAMSCGLPVIANDSTPGVLELIEHGVTGIVVPADDAPALAAALHAIFTDETLRQRVGQAARVRVAEYELPHAVAVWESVVGLPA